MYIKTNKQKNQQINVFSSFILMKIADSYVSSILFSYIIAFPLQKRFIETENKKATIQVKI